MIPIGDENPTKSYPWVNTLLLVANIGVFIYGFFHPGLYEAWVSRYAFVAADFFRSPVQEAYRLVTYMFFHAGWMHLAGNMLFLYIFGDNVEDRLGHFAYLVLYCLGGIGGALLQGWMIKGSIIPMVGASAAISAVVVVYALFFPFKKVVTLFFFGFFLVPIRIPALIYILFWVVMQVVNSVLMLGNIGLSGGVAYLAHLGGIGIGFLWALFGPKKRSWNRSY